MSGAALQGQFPKVLNVIRKNNPKFKKRFKQIRTKSLLTLQKTSH